MADQEESFPAPNPPPTPVQAPQAAQGQQLVHLNLSYFKPEISGNPDEDAEAHLLFTNDWMNAHHFNEGVKVQKCCLALLGEARLWHQSLEPINADWQGLQNLFRQQYSKIGNTREQLFYAWRSFNFDENTKTIDTYITCIRQVAALLGYGEPHILEVFKDTLPIKLYWIVFPIVLYKLCHLQDHFRTKYDNRIYLIANTLWALNSPLYFHYLLASYKEITCTQSKTKRKWCPHSECKPRASNQNVISFTDMTPISLYKWQAISPQPVPMYPVLLQYTLVMLRWLEAWHLPARRQMERWKHVRGTPNVTFRKVMHSCTYS